MRALLETGVRSARGRALLLGCALAVIGLARGSAEAQLPVRVNTDQRRSIGGVTRLDRERFFAQTETLQPPGSLNTLIGSPDGPNVVTGRISTEFDQFIAQNLPEDPTRPGFIDPAALRGRLRGAYRNFVENSSRYTSIRNNGNAFVVNGGRRNAFFPDYFTQPGTDGVPRADAYAEFINIYLEEAVFGPDAFLPVPPDRFAVELLNEPDLDFNANFNRQDLADFHREVTQRVLAVHPNALIGGPSLAVTTFEDSLSGGADNFDRFEEHFGRLIADRSESGIGFYSFHPYERYDVTGANNLVRSIDQSPGRVNGTLDLVRARDLAENPGRAPLPIALSEYGSFNLFFGDPDAAGYTRSEQQFDLSRDVREQLLVYLNRPDVVLNATPFIQGFPINGSAAPTPAFQDNVFYERDASGVIRETILAQTFRAYANVSGEYIGVEDNRDDLQTVAFRDGGEVYVLINNLLDTPQAIDLNVLTAVGGVASATADRLFQQGDPNSPAGAQNVFVEDEDITGNLGDFLLNPNEGAVLTLTLTDDADFGLETVEETFFSRDTVLAITNNGAPGTTPVFAIDAELDDSALSATLRLTYNRPEGRPDGEGFEVFVNGATLVVDEGVLGIDDGDFGLQTREIEVPLELLVDGANDFQVDFFGIGGFVASSALVVTSDANFTALLPGDYNDDGVVDAADYTAWRDRLGADAGTLPNDVDGGVIGVAQYQTFVANFGASSAASTTAAPEPAGALLVLPPALTCLGRRRTTRSASAGSR